MSSDQHKVFIIDDHPLVREWLIQLIEQQSDLIVCGQSDSASAGLDAVILTKPEILVLDVSLPDSSGLDIIGKIKQNSPNTKIIILSMHEESTYGERALACGVSGYITKSETAAQIIIAIRKVLTGKLYISEQLGELMAKRLHARSNGGMGSYKELLSSREFQIFESLGRGIQTRDIAKDLHLSIKTVQTYCARIKDKLGLENASALLREAVICYINNDDSEPS